MRRWWLIDAKNKTLGRLATKIAELLMGKYKPNYLPYRDDGDFVICINARKVKVTGKKEEKKVYVRHSGYLGGIKFTTLKEMKEKHPERIIFHAVSGMLPKNKLRAKRLKRLKIYPDENHPHAAQKPIKYEDKI